MAEGIKLSFDLSPEKLLENLGLPNPQKQQGQGMFPVSPELTPNVAEELSEEMSGSANLPDPVQQPQQLFTKPQVDPARQALLKQFDETFAIGQEQRQGNVDLLKDALAKSQGREQKTDFSALAPLIDSLTGSKFTGAIKAPESEEERDARLFQLQRAINLEESGITQSEIEALKAKLSGGSRNELRRASIEGRDRRFTLTRQDKLRKGLGNDITKDGLIGVQTTFDEMQDAVPGGLDNWKGQDIPSVGVEALLPIAKLSPDGARIRRLTLSLGNQIIKMRTGAAMSNPEALRIMGELGFDQALLEGGGKELVIKGTRTKQDWINGVRAALDSFRRQKNVRKAQYGQEAWDVVSPGLLQSTRKGASAFKKKKAGPVSEKDIDKMSVEELKAAGLID